MNNEYFKTADLPLASFLYLSGKQLKKLEPEGKKFFFCFANLEACQNLADEFWFGEPCVNPRAYNRTFKNLKEMVLNYDGR